jgi:hypothetical protein
LKRHLHVLVDHDDDEGTEYPDHRPQTRHDPQALAEVLTNPKASRPGHPRAPVVVTSSEVESDSVAGGAGTRVSAGASATCVRVGFVLSVFGWLGMVLPPYVAGHRFVIGQNG